MVRTQLYLSEEIQRRLKEVAKRQGRTVSDLVREAITVVYGEPELDDRADTLEGIASLWQGRKDLGDTYAYVRRLRKDTRRHAKTD